jgi:hypothetical protein
MGVYVALFVYRRGIVFLLCTSVPWLVVLFICFSSCSMKGGVCHEKGGQGLVPLSLSAGSACHFLKKLRLKPPFLLLVLLDCLLELVYESLTLCYNLFTNR